MKWHFKQANHGAYSNLGTQVGAQNKDFSSVSQTFRAVSGNQSQRQQYIFIPDTERERVESDGEQRSRDKD